MAVPDSNNQGEKRMQQSDFPMLSTLFREQNFGCMTSLSTTWISLSSCVEYVKSVQFVSLFVRIPKKWAKVLSLYHQAYKKMIKCVKPRHPTFSFYVSTRFYSAFLPNRDRGSIDPEGRRSTLTMPSAYRNVAMSSLQSSRMHHADSTSLSSMSMMMSWCHNDDLILGWDIGRQK